jgi:hypothetical protein
MKAMGTARAHFLLLNKDGFKSQSKVVDVIDMNVRISEVTKFKTYISGIASELERRKSFQNTLTDISILADKRLTIWYDHFFYLLRFTN